MKLLVLGVNGFIGSNLSRYLSECGFEIVGADIPTSTSRSFISFDPYSPDFKGVLSLTAPDICINCTGAASVPASFADPLLDFRLNTGNVVQILEAIRKTNPAIRFLNFSSAAVYGDGPCVVSTADQQSLKPLSPYGYHKALAEQICLEYTKLFDIKTISLRVFSAYGPHLRKQIFWDIYQKTREGNPIHLFGTGEETRDFVYVDDISQAVELLIMRGDFDGRQVNVATGTSTTIKEAAQLFLKSLGLSNELVFSGSVRSGDPTKWKSDIGYLTQLGFDPKFKLREGLSMVAGWLKSEVIGA